MRPPAAAGLPSPAPPPPPPLLTPPGGLPQRAQPAHPCTPPPLGVQPQEGGGMKMDNVEIFQGKGWNLCWTNTARLSFLFTSTF